MSPSSHPCRTTDKLQMLNSLSSNFTGDAAPVWRGRGLTAAALAGQMALLAAAFWLALAIRYDFSMRLGAISWVLRDFLPLLPMVLGIKLALWLMFGLHRGVGTWRYTSLGDATRVFCAGVLSLALIILTYNTWQMVRTAFEFNTGWRAISV